MVGLAACGSGSSGGGGNTSSSSKNIVIALQDEPSTLDPQTAEDGQQFDVTDNINQTLLDRRNDTNNTIYPLLAASMPKQLSSTVWQFKLRTGISFTDGEPFNAQAAAYSINRILDPKLNSAQLSRYDGIKSAKAINATTLNVTTDGFDPTFESQIALINMVPPNAASKKSFASHPIGTGPYEFVRWDRGTDVVIKANPNYWGTPKPTIPQATFRFISQSNSAVAALKTGEIQLATNIPPELASSVPQVLSRSGLEFPVVRLKNYAGPLKDPRVRQAINYAVDKEALAKNLFSGYATVAQCQTLDSHDAGFDPSLQPYPYDPAKAKALLKAAGYNGQPITFLGVTGRWLKDNEMEQAILGYLKDVGLNIKPKIFPFNSYIPQFVKTVGQNQPDMAFVSASNELSDASQISSYYAKDGSLSSYVNNTVTNALKAASTDKDTTTRNADLAKALQIGCQTDPVDLFTVNLKDIYGASSDLHFAPWLDGGLRVDDMSFGS
ncbi:MAG TPA: ABC transporter substrate-binding protein [Mycobacteriales bacterium]|nr:ABC transporter substrate-binding protein [Mycobacteriales bacterium]